MPPPHVTETFALPASQTAERLPPPADRLPTLTEVVLLGAELAPRASEVAPPETPAATSEAEVPPQTAPPPEFPPTLEPGLSAESLLASALPGGLAPDAHTLTQQVLAELAPRIDALFEARLREALAPALARAADTLIRQSRDELTLALGELVRDAVARTLRRPD